MSQHHEVDDVTGVETTGHVWDGDLKELNKPLPRWWLYTFYVCIVWAIGYQIAYPAWPLLNGYTKGVLNYSQRDAVARDVDDAKAAQKTFRDELLATPVAEVSSKPDVLHFAMASGASSFAANCSPCHGRGAQGFAGYPNLNDDDWLWGGTIDDVLTTITYGIRSDHKKTRSNQMPRFGIDKMLEPAQINDAAEYVLSLSGQPVDTEAAQRGGKLFAEQCVACHGEGGKGSHEMGAPNLSDAIWLYGSTREDVTRSISTGRGGMMPAWTGRLDDATVKALAIYVHNLGGGK